MKPPFRVAGLTSKVSPRKLTLSPRSLETTPTCSKQPAWLHDVGYAPELADTGFHPLDGARYLRDVEQADPTLCRLVANHSCAIIEAEERGLAEALSSEFPPPPSALSDALAYCDMTTTPTGEVVAVRDRLSKIAERYGPHDVVTRFIRRAERELVSSVARTGMRLCLAQ